MSKAMTEGQLYDFLRERFGIGTYDDAFASVPYYRARMLEVGKLKRLLKGRHCTVEQVHEAALYALERRLPITETWHLTNLVPDALAAKRAAARQAPTDVRVRLEAAAAEAHEQGNDGWMQRLFTADDASGEEVLAAWEREKD